MSYPKRPQMFAMKFCRQLSKRAAAMHIGADGCWLLTVIAMQEDASHYEVAPQYYDIQLADRCGWHRTKVDRVRQKCIDAGYLHYEPGPHRGTSTYWVLLPSRTLPDDEPTSHGATQGATSTALQMRTNCTSTAPEMRTARDTYIPDPVPDPDPVKSKTPSPPKARSGGDGVQRMRWGKRWDERVLLDDSKIDELLGVVITNGFARDTPEDRLRFAALVCNLRHHKAKNRFGLFTRIIEGRSNDKFSKPGDDWRCRANNADDDRARGILNRLDGVQTARVVSMHQAEAVESRGQAEAFEQQREQLVAFAAGRSGKAAS